MQFVSSHVVEASVKRSVVVPDNGNLYNTLIVGSDDIILLITLINILGNYASENGAFNLISNPWICAAWAACRFICLIPKGPSQARARTLLGSYSRKTK